LLWVIETSRRGEKECPKVKVGGAAVETVGGRRVSKKRGVRGICKRVRKSTRDVVQGGAERIKKETITPGTDGQLFKAGLCKNFLPVRGAKSKSIIMVDQKKERQPRKGREQEKRLHFLERVCGRGSGEPISKRKERNLGVRQGKEGATGYENRALAWKSLRREALW